jgi:hypothetical protein
MQHPISKNAIWVSATYIMFLVECGKQEKDIEMEFVLQLIKRD